MNTRQARMRNNLLNVLSVCNETVMQSKTENPVQLEERIRERLRTCKKIKVPIGITQEELKNASIEDRMILSIVCLSSIVKEMDTYAKMLIFAKKTGLENLCDKNDENSIALDSNFGLLKDVSEGNSSKDNIEKLASFLSEIKKKKLNCILSLATGFFIRIDIILGILLVYEMLKFYL